jgi:formylglycine-generating enzyme required for sulfatase activity
VAVVLGLVWIVFERFADRSARPYDRSVWLLRVNRGGIWFYNAFFCRTAYRSYYYPSSWYYLIGFRSVLSPGQ